MQETADRRKEVSIVWVRAGRFYFEYLGGSMKTLDPATLQGIREDMDLYDRSLALGGNQIGGTIRGNINIGNSNKRNKH